MASIVLNGDTSGSVTLSPPAVAGTQTVTIPAATGTVMVSGNMPAFSAYLNGNQNVTATTWTKITINTKEFDTASCYNNSSTYRFTPTVAGYYQVNGTMCINAPSTNPGYGAVAIYKNGANFKSVWSTGNASSLVMCNVSSVIQFNGTTDYVELYGWLAAGGTGQYFDGAQNTTFFSATLVRTA